MAREAARPALGLVRAAAAEGPARRKDSGWRQAGPPPLQHCRSSRLVPGRTTPKVSHHWSRQRARSQRWLYQGKHSLWVPKVKLALFLVTT